MEIKNWDKWKHLFFFIIVPLVLISIHLMPKKTKENYFTLEAFDPSPISMLTSNFSHYGLFHLLYNLISYLVLIFLIFNIEKKKDLFNKVSILIFVFLPFLSSLIVYLYPEKLLINGFSIRGFSSIVSAFMGYSLYSFYVYLKKKFNNNLNHLFFSLLISISLLMVLWTRKMMKLVIFDILLILFQVYWNRKKIKKTLINIQEEWTKKWKNDFLKWLYDVPVTVATLTLGLSLVIILPTQIIQKGSLINTPSHYLGYMFGALIPILINKRNKTGFLRKINWLKVFIFVLIPVIISVPLFYEKIPLKKTEGKNFTYIIITEEKIKKHVKFQEKLQEGIREIFNVPFDFKRYNLNLVKTERGYIEYPEGKETPEFNFTMKFDNKTINLKEGKIPVSPIKLGEKHEYEVNIDFWVTVKGKHLVSSPVELEEKMIDVKIPSFVVYATPLISGVVVKMLLFILSVISIIGLLSNFWSSIYQE